MKVFLTILFVSLAGMLMAQDDSNKLSFLGFVNVGLHGPEVSSEIPITKKLLWENRLGIGMGSSVNNGFQYFYNLLRPIPYLITGPQYYYNFFRRQDKGKSSTYNSGQYIGLQFKYSLANTADPRNNQTLLSELHWGFQHHIGGKFLTSVHAGGGYLFDFNTEEGFISPTIGARLSYVIY